MKHAAGIFFTDGKSVLLMKRAGEGENIGTWALPGGKAHEDESAIKNASREVKEETGIKEIPGRRIDSMTSDGKECQFTTFIYRVDHQFPVKLSKEHSDYDWIPFEKIPSFKLHPKVKENFPAYLRLARRKLTKFSEWITWNNSSGR